MSLTKTAKITLIERIIRGFDFGRIRAAMCAVEWTYFDAPGVPTIERLRDAAREHLAEVINDPHTTLSGGGGFEAYRGKDDIGQDVIGLRFVLAEAEESINA